MNRRARATAIAVLAVLVLSAPVPPTAVAASTDDDSSQPVPTVSDFYPEDNNLSDCVGLVERPGCGSEARGGWRQALVFAALAGGLGLVGWRVTQNVRKNQRP
jgi:hypothetical protein